MVLIAAGLMVLLSQLGPVFRLPDPWHELAIAFFLAMAAYVALSAILLFKSTGTTVDPRAPEAASILVTDGVFRWTRNPMYLGLCCCLFALGTYLASLVSLVVVPVFILYITRYQILPEERALKARFGEQFDAYCKVTRRWL